MKNCNAEESTESKTKHQQKENVRSYCRIKKFIFLFCPLVLALLFTQILSDDDDDDNDKWEHTVIKKQENYEIK